jgi:DNA-directed RNA polymerase subunit RPC12/RpoP
VTRANCPSCGAPVEFAIGSSAVVVCTYCRSVVARTDRGVETNGQVAALIDTGSPLAVGVNGRYAGTGFRITGRTQLRHQAGGVWDEWYVAFDDGRWGWLAEAQGRLYVTFKTVSNAPAYGQLELGARVPGLEPLVVAEIGEAVIASAEGELPWRPDPGASYTYADLTGEDRRFATIDYSEEPPVVFKGTETSFSELGISGDAARTTRVSAAALNCTNCGGPLELKAPDRAERIWCPNCGAGHDITQGKLRYFGRLPKKRPDRVIANGATGTVDGVSYVVAGFMQRAVVFDQTYYWTEYLLYNRETGYRWLVHSDDHWSFVTPLRPGEVQDSGSSYVAKAVSYEGRRYKLFQVATAKVTYVDGEFYWRVNVGEQVDTADYIAPPFGISREVTTEGAQELSYSHARYMTPEEVESAFGVEKLTRPHLPGPMQPYTGPLLGRTWLVMLALLVLMAIGLAATRPNREVFTREVDLLALAPPEGAPPNGRVVFSEPFELTGRYNVAVDAGADVSNSWLSVSADLVNEATGVMQSFDLPIEYYSGVDGGESWSEGKRSRRVYLSRPDKGRYVLRMEALWEEGKTPPPLRVRVREGVFRFPHFALALVALSVFPVIALLARASFEARRWQESAYTPFGQVKSDDDDDEE